MQKINSGKSSANISDKETGESVLPVEKKTTGEHLTQDTTSQNQSADLLCISTKKMSTLNVRAVIAFVMETLPNTPYFFAELMGKISLKNSPKKNEKSQSGQKKITKKK